MSQYVVDKKNSFVLYHEWIASLNELGAKSAWKIILALCILDKTGKGPDDLDSWKPAERALYKAFAECVIVNRKKYEKRVETNRKNGQKGGAPVGNKNAAKKTEDDDADEYDDEIEDEDNPKLPKTTGMTADTTDLKTDTTDLKTLVGENKPSSVADSAPLSESVCVATPVAVPATAPAAMAVAVPASVAPLLEEDKNNGNMFDDDDELPYPEVVPSAKPNVSNGGCEEDDDDLPF